MTVDDAIRSFSDLPCEQKAHFLTRLAHEITIIARDTYDNASEGLSNPERMRCLNEVLHRVTGWTSELIDNAERYPVEVLVRTVLEHGGDNVLEAQLRRAFEHTLARVPHLSGH